MTMWAQLLSPICRSHRPYFLSYSKFRGKSQFHISVSNSGIGLRMPLFKCAHQKTTGAIANHFGDTSHSFIGCTAAKQLRKECFWPSTIWSPNLFQSRSSHFSSILNVCGKRDTYSHKHGAIFGSDKTFLSTRVYQKSGFQAFHSSPFRCAPSIPPILWKVAIMKLLSYAVAIITGRALRIWWRNLPPSKKIRFIDAAKKDRGKIAGFASLTSGIIVLYYFSRLEESPYTKRKRFMLFTPEQFKQISEFAFQVQIESYKNSLLPSEHPSHQRIARVAKRLLNANNHIKELQDKNWSISVVDENTQNASVFPNGQIFIFTGMLNICSNDDQLGVVLAHEVAHSILEHGAENLSYSHFLDGAFLLVVAAIWAVMPTDFISLIAHVFFNRIINIWFQLPYSRKLELEADEVGLRLAAKACFDVRESSAFWAKIELLEHQAYKLPIPEWLSTHPSNKKRMKYLDSIMDKNIELRKSYGCPDLTGGDPRSNVALFRESVEHVLNLKESRKLKHTDLIVIKVPTN